MLMSEERHLTVCKMAICSSVPRQYRRLFENIISHVPHLRGVLTTFRDTRGKLRVTRCFFFAENFNHLGHVIRPGKRKLSEAITTAICEPKEPHHTDGTELLLVPFATYLTNRFWTSQEWKHHWVRAYENISPYHAPPWLPTKWIQ